MEHSSKHKLVSIIIPCFNEEENINRTFDGLLELAENHEYDFEIIAIDDGSKDKTWDVIKKYAKKHDEIKGVNQMTNYGQTAAYMAGFNHSTGDYVITVSADLEIPLSSVNKVIDYLDEGYDFVNTNRVGRWGGSKAAKSGMANKLIAKISKVEVQDRGSGVKGFTKNLLSHVRLYGEMHRFIPDYVQLYGAKMIEFDVDFKDRDFGKSAYVGHKRTIKVILDLFTLAFLLYFAKKPFYAMPGRIFSFAGGVIAGLGGLGSLYLLVLKLLGNDIGGRPLFIVSILMLVMGIQSIMMGMLGELLVRIYFESGDREIYAVREIA